MLGQPENKLSGANTLAYLSGTSLATKKKVFWNVRQSGPSFVEQFKVYQASEEWTYFNDKKVSPLKDAYFQARIFIVA
jgi:hypothetical protein